MTARGSTPSEVVANPQTAVPERREALLTLIDDAWDALDFARGRLHEIEAGKASIGGEALRQRVQGARQRVEQAQTDVDELGGRVRRHGRDEPGY